MSRTIGLFVALLVGGMAAVLHFAALSKAQSEARVPTVGYAAVRNDYAIGAPLVFTPENAPEFFYQIDIPVKAKVPAVKIEDLNGVIGMRVPRALKAGELLLLQDLAPSNPTLLLGEGERALLVSVKNIAVEPKLLRVGQEVGFVIETPKGSGTDAPTDAAAHERLREIGPFRIVSVGDQVTTDVEGASSTISVAVKVEEGGKLPEHGAQLLDADEGHRLRALTLYRKSASK